MCVQLPEHVLASGCRSALWVGVGTSNGLRTGAGAAPALTGEGAGGGESTAFYREGPEHLPPLLSS